jgi:hypothetical protein
MSPHDLELKRYNEIMIRLDQIESILFKVMDHSSYSKTHKLLQDGVTLGLVYLKDVKDKLRRYAERAHD